MRIKFAIIAASAGTLAACGPSDAEVEANFRASFAESCLASAIQSGAPEDAAKTLCDCSVDKVIEEHNIELAITPATANDIMDRCVAETGVGAQG